MHVVLLAHSLNKDEALAEMRGDKTAVINWEWIRGLSLPLWLDNKEELRKIIEEVAANEYRAHKDPFDCLFWYLLVGKKSLLATLFKNHRLNSK
jgi:membrane protein required for beta-lactamase induction